MNSWSTELGELEKYLKSIKGQIQSLEKELNSLLNASEDVTALLFARRSLEVIVSDLCENSLKRPRGSEPLQSIVDKLSKDKKIPELIHTSMSNLIRISNYGAHPKDFDPRQVRGALIDLSVVVEWFISFKNLFVSIPELLITVTEPDIEKDIPNDIIANSKQRRMKLKAAELVITAKELMKLKQFDDALETLKTASVLDEETDEIVDLIIETSKLVHQEKREKEAAIKKLHEEEERKKIVIDSFDHEQKLKDQLEEKRLKAERDAYLLQGNDLQKKVVIEKNNKLGKIKWTNEVSGIFIDLRDEHQYKVVKIGTQIWFAENLSYIPRVGPSKKQGGIWVYGYDGTEVNEAKMTENYKEYGCLYDWKTASDIENPICPYGWHLPSPEEWEALIQFFDGDQLAGDSLKEEGANHWEDPNQNASNESEFSALPGGARFSSGTAFRDLRINGYWWSDTEYYSTYAWYYSLSYYNSLVEINNTNKINGLSVRCIKDLD